MLISIPNLQVECLFKHICWRLHRYFGFWFVMSLRLAVIFISMKDSTI